MLNLATKLRIGEKIGISSGIVGLLFLTVIWQYHQTLGQALTDYQKLQNVYEAKETHAVNIETSMLHARGAETAFLLHRKQKYVEEVERRVEEILRQDNLLKHIDQEASQTASKIDTLIASYLERFQAVVGAWENKGLDHESGLQGAFRDTVHELEDLAGNFKVGALYLQLLQIRRSEKDLGLRREEFYRARVLELINELTDKVGASKLEHSVKVRLWQEIETYRETFERYAREVLEQQPIHGGKGPFRQAAHRIEDLLTAHYVPDMEVNILQLRRREKDYLLRHDPVYVDMALEEAEKIESQIQLSAISAADKARLSDLLGKYRRDFLELVAQNERIDKLLVMMRETVAQISPLVQETVDNANRNTVEMTAQINASSEARVRSMFWIVLLAMALGAALSALITRRITRPLLRMGGLLDRLAYEEPTERVPTQPGSRNEVDAMAESVNKIADHKTQLIRWWNQSMHEIEAARDLQQLAGEPVASDSSERADAEAELADARNKKETLLNSIHKDIRAQIEQIIELSKQLSGQRKSGPVSEYARTIDESAKTALSILSVVEESHHLPQQDEALERDPA